MGKDYSSAMENPLGQRLRSLSGPILLTGHTGFKGTWMTFLLEYLDIPVVGYSLPAEKSSLYERADRAGVIPEVLGDIRDYQALDAFIDLHKPSTIIHMAAQPLVLKSYEEPRETFDVNVMGTVNVLDIAFKKDFVKAVIVVTTDKVYRNDNSNKAFIETDPLEGKDPYSASKVGTEAVVSAWQQISNLSGGPDVVSVRSGNVIGGGDWATDRLFPDLMRGLFSLEKVVVRNANSSRPWQHVLDPLVGYLMTLEAVLSGAEVIHLNFGPTAKSLKVSELLAVLRKNDGLPEIETLGESTSSITKESKSLDLNSNLAAAQIGWTARWAQEVSIINTLKWWKQYFEEISTAEEICKSNIREFLEENR
jgi:CDP-glucose 4,6-dehydratase